MSVVEAAGSAGSRRADPAGVLRPLGPGKNTPVLGTLRDKRAPPATRRALPVPVALSEQGGGRVL